MKFRSPDWFAGAGYIRKDFDRPGLRWYFLDGMATDNYLRSVRKLHQVVRQTGAMVVTGHDPDAWPKFKKAPEYYD